MDSREFIGSNIRILRTRRCWSQEHLARAAGINVRTVQRAEEGRGISMETVLAIAGALDVTVGALQAALDEESPGTIRSEEHRTTIQPPNGIVTFVFSEVQEATPLWERDPMMMRRAMIVNNAVLRRLIERHGGYEVRLDGETFVVAFADVVNAIEFCLAAQADLITADWPSELLRQPEAAEIRDPQGTVIFRGLRVRMGVHRGEIETDIDPTTGRADYYGRTVNSTARLVQAAHGGQVLVSRDTWLLAEDQVCAESEDLGEVRLRGLSQSMSLIQVHPRTPRRSFPPPMCEGAKHTNLAPARTSLVGRAEEVELITGWLKGEKRLISLVGPGGAGKTRLGRAAGAALSNELSGGVWLVELAPLRSLEATIDSLAETLQLELGAVSSVQGRLECIGTALSYRGPVLVILDNAEHLAAELVATVTRLLQLAPELRVLVTTQHSLGAAAEQICPVSGLRPIEAGQLFFERAQQLCPALTLTPEAQEHVREIVMRLEGLPLAIELAASRIKVLSVAEINNRLAARFTLLTSNSDAALPRHSTLRATIEWSYSLLKAFEKAALVDLARLPGSFDVATGECILDISAFSDAPSGLDVLQSLVEKSLIWASDSRESAGDTRLRMYESVRAFALEQHSEAGPRLVAWALARGEPLVEAWHANPSANLAKQLVVDLDNYAAAMDAAVDDNPDAGLRIHAIIMRTLGTGLVRNWCGPDTSVRERLWESAKRNPDTERRAFCERGSLRRDMFDSVVVEQDIARMEQLGGLEWYILGLKSVMAERRCAYEEAWEYAERGVAACADREPRDRLWMLGHLGVLAIFRELRPPQVARELLAEMIPLARLAWGPATNIPSWKINLELRAGNAEAALQDHQELLRSEWAHGRPTDIMKGGGAGIYYQLGRFDEALALAEEAREAAQAAGEPVSLVAALELIGSLHCVMNRDELAKQAWEEAASKPPYALPGRAFYCEAKLALLECLHGELTESRLNALVERPHAGRPDATRLLAALRASAAAIDGNVERCAQVIDVGNAPSAWSGPANWNALAAAFMDLARATRSKHADVAGEIELNMNRARQKLNSVPHHGDVALLARLIQRTFDAINAADARTPL